MASFRLVPMDQLPLSERLERDAAGIDRGDHFDIDAHISLIREAAAIVRAWEAAPTGLLYEVGKDSSGFVAKVEIDTVEEARKAALNAAQRVRLVPVETESGNG